MTSLEQVYGLSHPVKSFAIENEFVTTMNKGCYMMGTTLQPFAFGCSELQNKWGVVDLADFKGFYDESVTLYDEIVDYRRSVYAPVFGTLMDADAINIALFFDYLLSVSACYIEFPKYQTRGKVTEKKYVKGLYTRNPSIMAAWTGASPMEMQAKYGTRISQTAANFAECQVKAVKLMSNSSGNYIQAMREPLTCSQLTCMPLFMQYAFVCGAWTKMEEGIVKFTYLKDNDTTRELTTTVNFNILMDYYNDTTFIEHMLNGVDVFSNNQGGMQLSSKQGRGYVKVPELGCSKYDKSGVRALNISRLLGAEMVDSVPRTFINVDLDGVVENFKMYIDNMLLQTPDKVYDVAKALLKEEYQESEDSPIVVAGKLREYVTSNEVILTTTFRRILHMFMISNPQWFDNYTGEPVSYSAKPETVTNYGISSVEHMDF